MNHASNVYRLGVKELWSLIRESMMLVLIVYSFTSSIYIAATAMPDSLHKAEIAIVDEDRSPLSQLLALVAIGTVFFVIALTRFRRTIGMMT